MKIILIPGWVIKTIQLLLLFSLVLSFFNSFTYNRCDTKGYYLPATYLLCNLAELRSK